MQKSPFQFSLAALLLTVAVVAGVLAFMFQVPTEPARLTFMLAVVALSGLGITGAIHGQPALRTFCIGALIPIAAMLVLIVTNLHGLIKSYGVRLDPYSGQNYARFFGFGILFSIALGYLCVGFRWMIERRDG